MASQGPLQVYLLWHTHILDADQSDDKLLGVYSSEENANQRKTSAMELPGFTEFPAGFEVARCVVDRDEWAEGFVTS